VLHAATSANSVFENFSIFYIQLVKLYPENRRPNVDNALQSVVPHETSRAMLPLLSRK
jgi:hypothetical protein